VKIVLGLGNPGERYRWTRHNLGHKVVELLAERWGDGGTTRGALGKNVATLPVRIGGQSAVLAKSRTYMNRSGRAAVALREHYGIAAEDLVVVYDDADLELGRIRIRPEGGAGGHNGMRSVIAALATEGFPRIRLGVLGDERESTELADYVLAEFEADEEPVAEALVALGADAVEAVLQDGIPEAMNRFNGRTALKES
jgi:PTH1 family peptidyl-tRNA hydrolase